MENKLTQEEVMLAKILTLIDQHEQKQRQFLSAFDDFMSDIDNTLDITEK
jgi:hypothetical protein